MTESFGARLRRQREEQQIALTTIAEQTKIKVSLLEALERDDVSHWPSGIFRRAFIRAYAHTVGLNPDVIVAEFLSLYPDPVEDLAVAFPTEPNGERAPGGGGPPTRLRYMVGSAIDSLSRLRRPPSVEEQAVPARVMTSTPPVPEPELPKVAPPSGEPNPVHLEPHPAAADRFEPDLVAAANLCTELGRLERAGQAQPLLEEAARILDATGLIVWVWDDIASELRPTLTHGYSDKVIAQLPRVGPDADNPTAAAFRSARTCSVRSRDHATSALVVPMMAPTGCAGVLAMELQGGSEEVKSVRAIATLFAAQLAQLLGGARTSATGKRKERQLMDAAPCSR
jgi:hypothetical protein